MTGLRLRLALFLGLIVLKNLDDMGSIGPGMAICLPRALCGLVVACGISMPCRR